MPTNDNQNYGLGTTVCLAIITILSLFVSTAISQTLAEERIKSLLEGQWVINDELSDNTDDKVEAAIKADGGRVSRNWFGRKQEDRYRGGPADQELYDRISYDDVLTIQYDGPEITFEYADSYRRLFHDDGRRRSIGASQFYQNGASDFSFANWDEDVLVVEARPRDGGYTLEQYSLQSNGQQLRVEMEINPNSFNSSIILVRIFDRRASE